MIFEIYPSQLSPILATMSKLIGSKTAMPIFENVKFFELDGQYLLTAISGDQESTLTAALPLENVTGFHPMLVNIGELSRMVRAAEGSIFPLTFKTGTHNGGKPSDHQLCIDYGEGEYQLIYQDITAYPTTNVGQLAAPVILPAATVQQMSQAVAFTANNNLRPVMQCVWFDIRPAGDTRIVASDSKTLYLSRVPDMQTTDATQALLSSRTISILGQLQVKGGTIQMQKGDKFAVFTILSGGDVPSVIARLESRLTEGRLPRYDSIIPKNNNTILLDGAKFKKAVDRASVCANASTNQLRFDIVPGEAYITIKGQDVDTSRNARTTLEYKEQTVATATSLGLRADYLTRCINAIGTKDLTFTFTSAERACLLHSTDGQTTVLIMPQKLTDF